MRLVIYSALVLFVSGCADKEQSKFEVEGNIKNVAAKTVYLEESSLSNLQPVIVDSTTIEKDGSFDLQTLTKEESVYSLRLERDMYPFVSFINDSKKVTIDADFKTPDLYTIKGSAASENLRVYLKSNSQKVRHIYGLSKSVDSLSKITGSDSLLALQTSEKENAAKDLKQYTVNFINGSESPALYMFVLGSYQSLASNPAFGLEGFSSEEVNGMINKATQKFPKHQALLALNKSVVAQQAQQSQQMASALLNKPAPDFTLPDINDKPVSLSSFKGKYVLVDFWASWCRPCRMENPNVVKAYQKFRDKNFAILGVSLDRPGQKDEWLKAIKEDQLTWTHVSDLKYWDSQVVSLYAIEGIPYNVLLDTNGVVIGESLRGEDLEKKLAEVLAPRL